MKKSTKFIITGVLAVGIAGGAFAFGSHHYFSSMNMQEKVDMFEGRIAKRLELNDLQQDKLDQLTGRAVTILQQVKQDSQSKQVILQNMLNDQPLDQTALLTKITSKTTLVNEHAPEIVALLAGFVDSLSAEQKADLKDMMEKRRGHRFGRHGGWNDMSDN